MFFPLFFLHGSCSHSCNLQLPQMWHKCSFMAHMHFYHPLALPSMVIVISPSFHSTNYPSWMSPRLWLLQGYLDLRTKLWTSPPAKVVGHTYVLSLSSLFNPFLAWTCCCSKTIFVSAQNRACTFAWTNLLPMSPQFLMSLRFLKSWLSPSMSQLCHPCRTSTDPPAPEGKGWQSFLWFAKVSFVCFHMMYCLMWVLKKPIQTSSHFLLASSNCVIPFP